MTLDKRVVDLGVDCKGVLELWVAALRAKLAKAADALNVERASNNRRGGQPGDAGLHQQAGLAKAVRSLAAQRPGKGNAGIDNGVLAEEEGVSGCNLLVVVVNGSVAVAASGTGDGLGVNNVEMVPAPAEESRGTRIQEEVEARVGLVISKIGLWHVDKVVGESSRAGGGYIWRRKGGNHKRCQGIPIRLRHHTIGIHCAGEGVVQRNWIAIGVCENTLPLIVVRDR